MFGTNSHRRKLLEGLKEAIENLKNGGCVTIYIDGSFVTSKDYPRDYDSCYDITGMDPRLIDPIFFVFNNDRAAQKAKYRGEFLPTDAIESGSGEPFLDFFQIDKNTGDMKGIIGINLKDDLT